MDADRFQSAPDPGRYSNTTLPGLPEAPPPKYAKPKAAPRTKWLVIGAVILLALIGLGVWALTNHRAKPSPRGHKSTTTAKTPAAPSIPSTAYTSTNFNTSFNYPNGWTVIDSGNAPLSVTSPVENLISAGGKTELGEVIMTLAKQGALPSAFTAQAAAVLTSTKITYNQPSTTQAAQSYISFVQYPSTTTVGGLDGIYLTGNLGYQKYQTIPASGIDEVDPLVYVSFDSCASQLCPDSSRSPLTIASSEWNSSQFSAPLLLLFKSLSFD